MKFLIRLGILALAILFLVLINYFQMGASVSCRIINRSKFKEIKTVLIPGAGNGPVDGRPNLTFIGRIDTAFAIWLDYQPTNLILSGYEDYKYFHEVSHMYNYLTSKGVPDSILIKDEGSPDTFETLSYYQHHFGTKPVIILSQKHHLERALWIADKMKLDAYGYEVGGSFSSHKQFIPLRELGARIKARIEVLIYL